MPVPLPIAIRVSVPDPFTGVECSDDDFRQASPDAFFLSIVNHLAAIDNSQEALLQDATQQLEIFGTNTY